MSILDDAIREHLELKRAHGADEAELKKLEDEAFGPPQRPDGGDSFSEAPTEFLGAAEGGAPEGAVGAPPVEAPGGRREPNIADLQEAPPPPGEPAPSDVPAEEQPAPEPTAEEPVEAGPSTEERHAIAEQPTEFFDVEAEIDSEPASADAIAPSDDEIADAEQAEPRLASVDQIDAIESEAVEAEAAEEPLLEDEEEEDDFFSEQRLSDELNQALETPQPGEPQNASRAEEPIPPGPHTEETEAHYAERDREGETDEHDYEAEPGEEADHEEQPTQLYDFDAQEDDAEGEHGEGHEHHEHDDEADEDDEHGKPAAAYEPESPEHEDVLEETPSFLEDAPEDDDAWFEQRPPKDFDFDD